APSSPTPPRPAGSPACPYTTLFRSDIAQICLGSLFRAVPYSSNGATLSRLTTEMGLINVPDKEEAASYRYIFSLRATCTVHPDSDRKSTRLNSSHVKSSYAVLCLTH